ncbi:MAG: crossover junction endodeoxyribonuclease RuvC [SAR202 cluster bacterium]|nr:crossover junction endodeoxyribonuclease RuvC [SAR202 cluster bacterium]
MRVLGVDPGTQHMGYGVLEVAGPSVRCVAWGTLDAPRGQPVHQRLRFLYLALGQVVDAWRPDHLAIEEPFVAPERGAKSAVAVGQAQAVGLLLAAGAGMEVHRYLPSQVKSAVADYGASTKAQVQRTLQLVLGLPPEPIAEDASDAIAVALCHLAHWRVTAKVRTA